MKKISLLILVVLMLQVSVKAELNCSESKNQIKTKHIALTKVPSIEDELVKAASFPKLMPVYIKSPEPIVDELVMPYHQDGAVLKIWARKDVERDNRINDELITSKFKSKFGGLSVLKKRKESRIEDVLAKKVDVKNTPKIKVKNKYDFSKRQIPVQLKIAKSLSTKHKVSEGDTVVFETTKDVVINDEYLPEGTRVVGRIETISASDKMGTPANIVIDNFHIENRPDICLFGSVSKTGANRTLWVYPLYQAGNIMFYVAGFAFVPIHGGHAKVHTNDIFTLYYETN